MTTSVAQGASAIPLGEATAGGRPQQLKPHQTLCFRGGVAVDFGTEGYFFKLRTAPALHSDLRK